MKKLAKKEKIKLYLFDTTNKSQRKISFEVIEKILKDMRKKYITRLNNEKELINN